MSQVIQNELTKILTPLSRIMLILEFPHLQNAEVNQLMKIIFKCQPVPYLGKQGNDKNN